MYKQYYSRFLQNPDRLHFAAHSHHLWPDCTRQAVIQCWDDAARYADDKWDFLFESIIPEAQQHVARLLGSGLPNQIVFAPNTHEFIVRLFSCFPETRPVRILTSDSEFHSFSRQLRSWQAHGLATVDQIPSRPASDFVDCLTAKLTEAEYDMVFFSQVFFDSGLCVGDMACVISACPGNTMIVVDAYHSFAALPLDISDSADRVFWTGGGYKYAQSGEGVCWLHVPPSFTGVPANTGWYAAFGSLATRGDEVPFATDGQKFAGATFDPTGIYRFNAVMRWMESIGLTVESVHEYVQHLQQAFLQQLDQFDSPTLNRDTLLLESLDLHGHFFTFEVADNSTAQSINDDLRGRNVFIDYRGNRVRFGFGLYQDTADVELLFGRLRACPSCNN